MSDRMKGGLRGGVRCDCGREFEVIVREFDRESLHASSGPEAAFFLKMLDLATSHYGKKSVNSESLEAIRVSALAIERVLIDDEREKKHNATS